MTQELILKREQDGITHLSLNRPASRNALSLDMISQLRQRIDETAGDRKCRVLVLSGQGPAFCAGHDLRELLTENSGSYRERLMEGCSRLMMSLREMPQPVIAQVHGVATAAGCQLVASCDLAIATDTAYFATPGVNIGLFCHTPAVALGRAVGQKQAMQMLLTGELIDSRTALAMGLINRVVSADELERAVGELAEKIVSKSAAAIAMGKSVFYRQIQQPLENAYAIASRAMLDNLSDPDAQEGIDAFLAKRPPNWREP